MDTLCESCCKGCCECFNLCASNGAVCLYTNNSCGNCCHTPSSKKSATSAKYSPLPPQIEEMSRELKF